MPLMSHLHLKTVLADFTKNLGETVQLAAAAQRWVSVSFPSGVPRFSVRHKEIVTKLAFLQAFLAWETFLEESFTLYLLGKKSPIGRRPQRLVSPANRKEAMLMVFGVDRKYADWYRVDELKSRAKKCFRDGKPYSDALIGQKQFFEEMSIIRNAIAHSSAHSQNEFKKLAREKLLGAFPPKLTVGRFLATTIPGSSPPESFLEHYLDIVSTVAEKIVPT
jgi:hypothetical protein